MRCSRPTGACCGLRQPRGPCENPDMTTGPILQLEFNELTPRLMFRFMEEGHLPNFQRLFRESHAFTTDAEEEGMNLNPWIQWVTVHSGLAAVLVAAEGPMRIALQLFSEPAGRGARKPGRIVGLLEIDGYRWCSRRLRPRCSSCCRNSVAHIQHTHWRNLEPERFSGRPT